MQYTIQRLPALWILAGCLGASAAHAQSAGTLLVRLGATQIKPQVDSGDLSTPSFAGTKVDIGSNAQPTAGITYILSEHFSVDVPLSVGFQHDIVGAGAIAGVGKIGEVKALPATALLQYRFLGSSDKFRPYVGLGLTYARFYKARSTAVLSGLTGGSPANPTTLNVGSHWGTTFQLGASFNIAPKWSLDAAVLKTVLSTRATLSTGQSINAKLDPISTSVGVVYAF